MRKNESGFTLVEFSISSLATMIMLAATFTLMNMIFTANVGMADMMSTQQNVRVALNTIARDITMAGTGLPSAGVAVPNGTNSAVIIRPGMSGFAAPDRNLETENNSIPMLSPGNDDGPTVGVTDTDTLTIFSINQESPTWNVATIGVFTDRYELQFTQTINAGTHVIVPRDLLLFQNVAGSVLGCVNDLHLTNNMFAYLRATDVMGINQPTAAFGNIGSLSDGANPPAFPPTTAVRVNVVNYYLSTANAAHPRLMRAVNGETAQVIAEDVENLQFSYDTFDLDTNTTTSNLNTTTSPNQIRAVYIQITGRSADKMRRSNDYFRYSLVSKINVRNATFKNRYTGT